MFGKSFETAPPVRATILETAPSDLVAADTSNCCEDCPDVLEFPPAQSDCPYFFPVAGGRPECLRDKGGDAGDVVVEPPQFI